MDKLIIEPLRSLKITYKDDCVLITKEDNTTQTEWVELLRRVNKIAASYMEPMLLDVELKTALGKTYISLREKNCGENKVETLLGMSVEDMGFDTKASWQGLAEVLEIELQIEGYSVRHIEPDTGHYVSKRKAQGKPVVAQFLIEDDCITIGVTDLFSSGSMAVDLDEIMGDVKCAVEKINAMLRTLSQSYFPEIYRNIPDKNFCKRGHTFSGTHIYGVAEVRHDRFKAEELTIAARAAKNLLQTLGYEVTAERAQRIVTKIDL